MSRASYYPNVVHDALVFRRASVITSTSRWAADDLLKRYPACAGKVHVMAYPVRTHFPHSIVDVRFERTHAEPGGPVQVLFIGGDFRRKGGPELLQAWHAGRFEADAALHLVTDWPAAQDGLPDGVRIVRGITPHSDAWKELWRTADLFVMPSRHEAFGMVYQEAAAAGLPVVATRLNAIPEIVEDGRTGILVPPGDQSALVQAMRALVDSAELRRRMGAAAIARVAGATPAAYAARLQRLITAALDIHDVYAA